MTSSLALLTSRRFGPLFACTCLGAFNDNYFKNALTILITYTLATQAGISTETFISFAAALFILPFFLCSGVAGVLADHYPKHQLVRILKLTELALFTAAFATLVIGNATAMLVVLGLIGVQAAFYGPVKYAILPQLLPREDILAGNGLTEAGTFVSILLGSTLGGLLILQPGGVWWVGGSMVLMGAIGVGLSRLVPAADVGHLGVAVSYNIWTTTRAMLRHAASNARILSAILCISWFWAVGVTYLTQLPVFTRDVIGGNEEVVTLFFALFSIGVGIGSALCHRLLKGEVNLRAARLALMGVALFGVDLWLAARNAHHGSESFIGIHAFLEEFTAWRMVFDLTMLSICGGLFIVPLYTLLQVESDEAMRARTIASNNVVNALFISGASLLAALAYAAGADVEDIFLATALMNLPLIGLMRGRLG
jgi:acyl-[acyl-carrier-protein]-phospholipid O-acyltransferase/long-chain-fatty-acid--[acyl-carrier-protein] ligase